MFKHYAKINLHSTQNIPFQDLVTARCHSHTVSHLYSIDGLRHNTRISCWNGSFSSFYLCPDFSTLWIEISNTTMVKSTYTTNIRYLIILKNKYSREKIIRMLCISIKTFSVLTTQEPLLIGKDSISLARQVAGRLQRVTSPLGNLSDNILGLQRLQKVEFSSTFCND